mgnify:CR=1 FL=1
MMHFRFKPFTMSMYTKIKFSLNRLWEEVQKLFILKLEPDFDPEPEKLGEHGPAF